MNFDNPYPRSVVSPESRENAQLRMRLIDRSLTDGRWATPRTLGEADRIVETIGNPLIDRLKDRLTPFSPTPFDYSGALGQAYDLERAASDELGINCQYEGIKANVQSQIAPKLRQSFVHSYGDPTRNYVLPPNVYQTMKQMLEATQRSISWELTSQAPTLMGRDNPFFPFVQMYMNGIVKVKFTKNKYGGQWVNAHIPLLRPGKETVLGCWTESEQGISGTHYWEENCNKKRGVSLGIAE